MLLPYYNMRWSVAAVCIVWRNKERKEIALIKRRADHPHHLVSCWFFPGGVVETDEQPFETALREANEECCIKATNPLLVDVYGYTEFWVDTEGISKQQKVLLVVYQAIATNDEIEKTDECDDAAWIPLSKIQDYVSKETKRIHMSDKVIDLIYV